MPCAFLWVFFIFFLMLSCLCLPSGPVLNHSVLSFLELSLCAGTLQLDSRRREFASSGNRKLYFDTHALVCVLEENGNPLPVVTRCHRETLYLTASWWSHLISHISLWLWSLQVAFWSVSMFLSSLFFFFFFCLRAFLLHQYNWDFSPTFSLCPSEVYVYNITLEVKD